MPEGSVTYSAEGTSYGPQQGHGSLVLTLQYGEASQSGYMSYDRLAEGSKRLSESSRGYFDNGTWRYTDGGGAVRNQDAYEAIWEEINGCKVEYPPPRYETPITMHPDAFAWVPAPDEPGVAHKHLGTFSERRTSVGFMRYHAGATHRVHDLGATELQFVVSGALQVAAGRYDARSAFKFDPGDDVVMRAIEPAATYVIRPGRGTAEEPISTSMPPIVMVIMIVFVPNTLTCCSISPSAGSTMMRS
jgi:hypothetical protein